jgi:hypothetical protein
MVDISPSGILIAFMAPQIPAELIIRHRQLTKEIPKKIMIVRMPELLVFIE